MGIVRRGRLDLNLSFNNMKVEQLNKTDKLVSYSKLRTHPTT